MTSNVHSTDLERCATDFGGAIHALPRTVILARNAADVTRALAQARVERVPVAARGQGHAGGGQALVQDGMVIDMQGLNALEQPRDEAVWVGAGALWRDVLAHCLRHERIPPVITDYLGVTVGGTLSVGGIGGQTFVHGAQTDQVHELEVALLSGELVRCSPQHEPELFTACLGGVGQHGIITSARLRLIPAPRRVRTYEALFTDATTFLSLHAELAVDGEADHVGGLILPGADGAWGHLLQVSYYVDDDAPPDAAVLARLEGAARLTTTLRAPMEFFDRTMLMIAELQAQGVWEVPHPWVIQFVPEAEAPAMLTELRARLGLTELGSGYLATYPVQGERIRQGSLQVPDTGRHVLIGVLPDVADRARLPSALALGSEILELGARHGARVYPVGLLPPSEAWPLHFGSDWPRWLTQKRRFDPTGLLAPGVGMRAT